MANKDPQPGKISYFFGKGYSDLWNTIKGSWARNTDSFHYNLDCAKENGIFTFGGGVRLVAALSIIVYGSIITLLTSGIHIGILFMFFLLVYVGFSIVWLIDRIYIYINKIKNACPNPACQASFLIPTYLCPDCGVEHTHLVPGKYGILKRRCNCGSKIPTTFLNGRGNLSAICPECGYALSGSTASKQYAIPVIGGPSVGKTCYINMALDQLINTVSVEKNWNVDFISEEDKMRFNAAATSMSKGIRPAKTDNDALTAYQIMLTLPGESIGRRLYVYDIAGEMFSSSGDVQRNNAYNYANGFIFMIDPLSIARFASECEDKIKINTYGVSSKDFEDILNIMLINLEKMFGISAKDVLKLNLAVVINKMDVPGLEEKIGDTAVTNYMSEHPECKTAMDAKNIICKNFLETYEAGNFVRSAESKFKNIQYFTCSALGHNKEGVPFESHNVTEPLLWILSNIDSKIKV